MGRAICEVRGLEKHFPIYRGVLRKQVGAVRAVDGVTFDILDGETLGLVGESGSGKSTTGRAILQLVKPTAGRVTFRGNELTTMAPEALRRTRRQMQMIFQDPEASLNPRIKVGACIREPMDVHEIGSRASRAERVRELLHLVGLSPALRDRYPHEFSGGQRQRIAIARALATHPKFIVADEPLSALDVSIQAQIVNLLESLKEQFSLTYLFIAHDLPMIRHISDRVAVMYLGLIVEITKRDDLFRRPLHPYTHALLSAIPVPDPSAAGRPRPTLPGEVPVAADPPSGCRFHTRCAFATERCRREAPKLRDLGQPGSPHLVACHHAPDLDMEAARGTPG